MKPESITESADKSLNLTLQNLASNEKDVQTLADALDKDPQTALKIIHQRVSAFPLVPQNVKGEEDIHTAMLEAYGSKTLARLYSRKDGLIVWLFGLEMYKFNGYLKDGMLFPDILLTCFQPHSTDDSLNCLTLVVSTNDSGLEFESAVFDTDHESVSTNITALNNPETFATIILNLSPHTQRPSSMETSDEIAPPRRPKSIKQRQSKAEKEQSLLEQAIQMFTSSTHNSNQKSKDDIPMNQTRYRKMKLLHSKQVKQRKRNKRRNRGKRKKRK